MRKITSEKQAARIVTIILLLLGVGMIVWQSMSPSEPTGAIIAISAVFFFAGWAFGLYLLSGKKQLTTDECREDGK